MKLTYAEFAGAHSRPEQMEALQCRWQKCWVKNILDDKPRWIENLQGLGAKGYRAGLTDELATVWDKRNDIVHSRATQPMGLKAFLEALGVIDSFVEPTDRFVVGFLAAHPLP